MRSESREKKRKGERMSDKVSIFRQLVRINDEQEDEINTGSPIFGPNENSMRRKVNVNVLERADESDPETVESNDNSMRVNDKVIKAEFVRADESEPETVKSKDNSVFSSLDDDSTLIPLKSRHDRI
jgi:hypothetical protein